MEHPCASQSTKGRTRGEGAGFCFCPFSSFFFFFPGVAFVLDCFLVILCDFIITFLSLFVIARTFFNSLELRLARFLFWDFCTPPLKYLMAGPQQNSGK